MRQRGFPERGCTVPLTTDSVNWSAVAATAFGRNQAADAVIGATDQVTSSRRSVAGHLEVCQGPALWPNQVSLLIVTRSAASRIVVARSPDKQSHNR